MRRMRDPVERFWSHVDKDGPGGCWLWTGNLNHLGYARYFITVAPKTRISVPAHQFAYEALVGPAPDGLEPDHLCRVRHCVNPAHVEWVTHRENVLRGTSFMATKAAQETCVNGHPFTEENIYRRPGRPTWRACRQCLRDRARELARAKRRTRNAVS